MKTAFLWRILILTALTFTLFTFGTLKVFAQEPPTADEVNAIAKHLNCPTCDTRSLDQCSTQTCIQWKNQIRDLMMDGLSEQEILDWYVARYGDYVLQAPPARGAGLLAWLLPAIAILAGGGWVGFLLKRWSSKRAQTVADQSGNVVMDETVDNDNNTDDYLKQVEKDLADL